MFGVRRGLFSPDSYCAWDAGVSDTLPTRMDWRLPVPAWCCSTSRMMTYVVPRDAPAAPLLPVLLLRFCSSRTMLASSRLPPGTEPPPDDGRTRTRHGSCPWPRPIFTSGADRPFCRDRTFLRLMLVPADGCDWATQCGAGSRTSSKTSQGKTAITGCCRTGRYYPAENRSHQPVNWIPMVSARFALRASLTGGCV